MRAPYNWLESYCESGLSAADLADRLTMTGTKVEALHRVGVRRRASSSSGACSRPRSTPTPTG